VVAVARTPQSLEALRAEITNKGGRCEILAADATEHDAPHKSVDLAAKRYGRLDALIYSAGAARASDLTSLDVEIWKYHLELMLHAPIRFVQAAFGHLERSGNGRIIFVVSTAARQPTGAIDYDTAKVSLLAVAKTLSIDLAPRNILVNCICPGSIETPLWLSSGGIADQLAEMSQTSREKILEGVIGNIPLRRFGRPSEIAAVMAFMVSPRNSYMTGASIVVDGGSLKGLP